MVSPDLDLTNSLLMNRPRGCVYFRPLGAVNSTNRSDMLVRLLFHLVDEKRWRLLAVRIIRGLRKAYDVGGETAPEQRRRHNISLSVRRGRFIYDSSASPHSKRPLQLLTASGVGTPQYDACQTQRSTAGCNCLIRILAFTTIKLTNIPKNEKPRFRCLIVGPWYS